MKNELKQSVLNEIDMLVSAIGLKGYEEFRSTLGLASVICDNAAPRLKDFAVLSREELSARLDETQEPELESGLRRLKEFRKYLPTLGAMLIQITVAVFPPPKGGAPKKLKTREEQRQVCSLILDLIGKGKSEPEAKRAAAKQLHLTQQTTNRTWSERAAIMEPSTEESLLELFKSLTSANTTGQNDRHPAIVSADNAGKTIKRSQNE